jgi:large repetitive protein
VTVVAVLAGVVAATAGALAFDDGTPCPDTHPVFVCPGGAVGASYSIQLIPHGGNGPPYTFILKTGSLPQGLSLNSSSGVISGTPTTAGSAGFGIELQDKPGDAGCPGCGCVARNSCSYRDFTLNVLAGLRITTNSLPPSASVGAAYSAPIEAMLVTSLSPLTGTPATGATWSIVAGSLPPGLTLGNGAITGTPTTEGTYQFQVQAALDETRKHAQTYTLVVRQPVVITPSAPFNGAGSATPAEVGVPISSTLKASGGSGTYTWALTSGALPSGVTMSNGSIAGRPTTAGVYRFTSTATDSEGRTASFPATIAVAAKLAISSVALKPAKVGKLYRARLTTTGGVPPKLWKVTSGPLPHGIHFDRALGLLNGTPTKPGRYRVTFEARDALKVTSTKTFAIVVLP